MSLPKELLSKVYTIELVTKRKIRDQMVGIHKSVFLDEGFDFEGYREYSRGDDVKKIDHHLFARIHDKAYIKRLREEKQVTVWILADLSSSIKFGYQDLSKKELLIKSIAHIGFSAIHNQDPVGLIIFTNKIEKFFMPKSGREWIVYLLNKIWDFSSSSEETDIAFALKKARSFFKGSPMVLLLSDFLDKNCLEKDSVFWKQVGAIVGSHDLIPVVFEEDPSFLLDTSGNLRLKDLESGKEISFHLSKKNREKFIKEIEQRHLMLRNLFKEAKARAIFLKKEEDISKFLKFFLYRKRGKG